MDSVALYNETARLVAIMIDRGLTLAVAESVTGGAFCAQLAQVPGVSAVLIGGVVVYTAQAKITLAGVDQAILAEHSTVSAETSLALAESIRERLGTDLGMAVTGNAGPTGEGDAPIGVIHWAMTGPQGHATYDKGLQGNRVMTQQAAVETGLILLSDYLEDHWVWI